MATKTKLKLDFSKVRISKPAPKKGKTEKKPKVYGTCAECKGDILARLNKKFCSKKCSIKYKKERQEISLMETATDKYRSSYGHGGRVFDLYIGYYNKQNSEMKVINTAKGKIEIPEEPHIPGPTGYSRFIGVQRSTIYNWAKRIPAMKKALSIFKRDKLYFIENKSMSGQWNKDMSKLWLNHDFKVIEVKEIKKEEKSLHLHGHFGVMKSDPISQVYEESDKIIKSGELDRNDLIEDADIYDENDD